MGWCIGVPMCFTPNSSNEIIVILPKPGFGITIKN